MNAEESSWQITCALRKPQTPCESARWAASPNADPALLRQLATSPDAAVREQVAGNPNAPIEVLLALGAEFPGALLANPLWTLMLFENPALGQEMPQASLCALVAHPAAPGMLLALAAAHPSEEVQLAAATNPHLDRALLAQMAAVGDLQVREAVALHRNWEAPDEPPRTVLARALTQTELKADGEQLADLAEAGAIDPFFFEVLPSRSRLAVAEHPETPLALRLRLLERLVRDGEGFVRQGIARRPGTPARLLALLAADPAMHIRSAVAVHPTLSERLVAQLATDPHERVREAVARNPAIGTGVLLRLARDRSPWVRLATAENPDAPTYLQVRLLTALASDPTPDIRVAVAVHPAAPPALRLSLLAALVADARPAVRHALALHPGTPADLLATLATDPDPEVRAAVAGHRSTDSATLERLARDRTARLTAFANPGLSAAVLRQMANHSQGEVRAAIATNPAVPEPTLAALATDASASVRSAAAANPAAPFALVEAMLDDPDEGVRRAAARHYRRQGGALARFLGVHAVGRPGLGRLIALWHPAVPVAALAAQARSIYWLERYAVARNPATPPAVRACLSDDGNRLVAAAARRSANRTSGTDG